MGKRSRMVAKCPACRREVRGPEVEMPDRIRAHVRNCPQRKRGPVEPQVEAPVNG